MPSWSNWSGSVTAQPRRIASPRDEDELAALLRDCEKARVVGAGHSFMPLCSTKDTLIRLDAMEGDLIVAPGRDRVSAPAGWSLKRLTQALWAQGLSLVNQGDVNPQSLAGAMATGTHGTGAELGSLSTQARAFRVMGPDGAISACSAFVEPDLFQAARLSLGVIGVATRIDVAVMEAYYLEEVLRAERFDVVREAYLAWSGQNRHVEFFVFPYAEHAIVKRLNTCPASDAPARDTDMEEGAFRLLCDACAAAPALTGALQKMFTPKKLSAKRSGPAHRIFPSQRMVRFEEMEYVLPQSAGLAALDALIATIRSKKLPVAFPFEVRLVAQDDIWMSPFQFGPSMTIAVHQYAKMPWGAFFAEAEAILLAHGGRPHWGKRHSLRHDDVCRLYPNADRFKAVRRDIDPEGQFLNGHLAALFGDRQQTEAPA